MTPEEYRRRLQAIEDAATDAVNRLVYEGVKPLNPETAKVDELIREAAITMGNRQKYAREIISIHLNMAHESEALDAEFYGVSLT